MQIKPIRTESDYELALKEIEKLMDATPGSDDFDKLEILSLLVEDYEAIHYPIDTPESIEAIKFRMEQEGLIQNDLVDYLGSKSRVSEVLNKKRKLTLNMIRKLNHHLNIPLENLTKDYKLSLITYLSCSKNLICKDIFITYKLFYLKKQISAINFFKS